MIFRDLIKILSHFSIDRASIMREKHLRLGAGVCLPSTCSAQRVQSFVNDFLESADLQITNDYDQSQWCLTNDSEDFKTIDIVCM